MSGSEQRFQARANAPVVPYTISHPDLKTDLPEAWQAVQNLKSYSKLGQKMMEYMEDSTIALCERNMDSVAGLWESMAVFANGYAGQAISLNPENKPDYERLLAHESFHSYQHGMHNLYAVNRDLELRERILHTLLLEAGAETLSAIICYDMKKNGCERPFENAKSMFTKHKKYARLYRVYENNAEKNGTDAESLKQGATQVFNAYLRSSGLVSSYAQGVISGYLQNIQNGDFKAAPTQGKTRAKARAYCDNLIDDIALPENDDDLFVGNTLLRQLAAWAEYTRWQQYEGDSAFVQTQRAELEQDGNPFMNIRLADLCEKLKPEKGQHFAESKPVLAIACEMAGLNTVQPQSQKFNQYAAAASAPTTNGPKPPQRPSFA